MTATKQAQKIGKPLGDRVVIRRVEETTKTEGGIFIPDQAKEKPLIGEIVAVGEGKRELRGCLPLRVKVGDQVLFGKYAGTEIEINNEKLLIVREEEILMIL